MQVVQGEGCKFFCLRGVCLEFETDCQTKYEMPNAFFLSVEGRMKLVVVVLCLLLSLSSSLPWYQGPSKFFIFLLLALCFSTD